MRASQLIASAKVVENVNHCLQTPASEAQTRPLTHLKPEQQKKVWKKAVETAPEGKVTARHIENVERNCFLNSIKLHAKAHRLGIDYVNRGTEVRLLAARRIGELKPAENPKESGAKGGRGKRLSQTEKPFQISPKKLTEFRKLAEIPMKEFKERIAHLFLLLFPSNLVESYRIGETLQKVTFNLKVGIWSRDEFGPRF